MNNEKKHSQELLQAKLACKVPWRAWIAVMMFFTTYMAYVLRANQSLSITAMVTRSKGDLVPECKREEGKGNETKNHTLPDYGVRYDWSENDQGLILASYGIGTTIGSLPSGLVAEWLGPYWTIFIATLVGGLFNSLCVPAATLHYAALCSCRAIVGFVGGFIYPALHTLISKWAPPKERGKFIAALMGNTVGTACTWYIVAEITRNVNWYWGFHCLTIQAGFFCLVFVFIAADSPDKHKWISAEEVEFIKASQEGQVTKTKAVPPYLKFLTSVPFWALTAAQFGNLWGMYLQLTAVPKFLNEVVGFKLREAGVLGALPHLARLIMGFAFGILGDYLVKTEKMSKTKVRKGFVLFSHLIPGALLMIIVVTKCDAYSAVAMLTVSLGMNGASCITHLQNNQELAPNFAGSMWGVVLFIGSFVSFICPMVTGAFINEENSIKNWSWNFILGGSVYIVCGVVFIIFGSTKVQPWNEKKEDKRPED